VERMEQVELGEGWYRLTASGTRSDALSAEV
jgi:hypothetical protein